MLELIEKARAVFAPNQVNQQSAVSFVGFVYDDGFVMSNNTACHASMSYPPHPGEGYGVFADGDEPEDEYDEDQEEEYYEEEEDYEE
jgi:hypothetical protein